MQERDNLLTEAIARIALILGSTLVVGWMLIRAFDGLSAEARAFLLGLALGAFGAGAPLVAALIMLRRTYHAEAEALRQRADAAREESLRAQQAMWHNVVGRQVIERLTAPIPSAPPAYYAPQPPAPAPPRPMPPALADDLADWPEG